MPTLQLNKEIYPEGSVSEAVAAFAEHAEVKMTGNDKHWLVEVSDEDADHALLVTRELGNMALGLAIDSGSVGN